MELVERDALMHAWLTGTPGRRVTIDNALDPQLKTIVDAVEAQGGAVEIYLLDTSLRHDRAVSLAWRRTTLARRHAGAWRGSTSAGGDPAGDP